jgi:hypothetical protein
VSWADGIKCPKPSDWNPSDCGTFWMAVKSHFGERSDDYPWLANGPRSEVWYTTELIAALGNACPGTWLAHRIMGEETYNQICRNLGSSLVRVPTHAQRRPDLNIISGFSTGKQKVTVLCEAKLIANEKVNSDLDVAIFGKKGLISQLKRAKDCFPEAACFGLIFVQWIEGRHYFVDSAEKLMAYDVLLGHCSKYLDTTFLSSPNFSWCSNKIEAVIPAPERGQHHPKLQNRAGLGIGMIQLN